MPQRLRFVYPAALLVEALVFFRHVLFYPGYVFPWDFRAVHVPLATLAADSFRRGEFPLWDPYTYCGNPIFANIQAALFYPPVMAATLAASWMGDGAIPRLLAIGVVAQVFFAGLCTYALARRLGTTGAAAWIAGTMYELGCFFAAQSEHMGVMQGAAWLPFCWLAAVELRERWRWRWVALLSLAFAMAILAGSPPCTIAVFGSTLALAVLFASFGLAQWKLLARVVLAIVWALALAAVQILPTMQLTENSVAKYRTEWLKSGGGMNPGALITLLIPNYWSVFEPSKFHGPTDLTFLYLYSSLLGLVLAATALWRPDRWRRAFAALTIAAMVAMLGDNTPVGRGVLAALPVNIRIAIHPEYIFCAFSLGLALLAGMGASRLIKNTRLQVAAGVIIACDLILVSSGRPMNAMSLNMEPGFTRDSIEGSRALAARLRSLAESTTPPFRFDMLQGVPFVWSSMAPVIGIPTANGCDPLAPERIIRVRLAFSPGPRWGTCFQVVDPASPALGLANVRYLISVTPVDHPVTKLVDSIGGYKIYENTRTLPRFFLAGQVRRARNLEDAANILRSPGFDPSQTAIVEGAEHDLAPATSSGRIDVLSYKAAGISLQTRTTAASFLVAADSWYPGWQASVDGKLVPLYITDVALRGISVPGGDHKVEMRFVPRILYESVAISVAALLVLFASLIAALKKTAFSLLF